jgi:tetratricopeptide (TPR) repeat protein
MLLLWIATALATDLTVRQAPCPYGTGLVKIYDLRSANNNGGYDSDLARYATEGQFRTHAMSTCPDTMFSLYGEDMDDTIDPNKTAAIEAALAKVLATIPDRASPAVWDRYAIGAAMYRALGEPPEIVGDVYLEASWTARDEAVGVYVGLEGPKHADEELKKGQAMLATVDGASKKTLLFNLARIAERAGHREARDRYLDLFAKEPLEARERQALERFQRATRDAEPRLQDLAIAEYRKALASGKLEGSSEARVQYLLADLLRRRGATSEAKALYAKVAARTDTPPELATMAGYLQNASSVR